MPTTIVNPFSQPASAGADGVGKTAKKQSDEFSSLLAVLFALTAPAAPAPEAPTEDLANTANNDVPQTPAQLNLISTDSLGTLLDNMSEIPPNTIDPATSQALSDLATALKQLEEQLGQNNTVDQNLVDNTLAALTTLSASLDKAAVATTPSDPLGATQPTARDSSAAAPLVEQVRATAEPRDTLAARLNTLAEKLVDQQPALSEKLQQFSQKLHDLMAGKQAHHLKNAAADGEIANAVSTLLGGKEAGQPKTIAPEIEFTRHNPLNHQPAKQDTAPQTSQPTAGNREDAAPTPIMQGDKVHGKQATGLALNAAAHNPAAKPEIAAQTDPIIIMQSNGNLTLANEPMTVVKTASAPYQQPSPNLNLPHIAYEFVQQVRAGASRFQIRLDPPEMGRIDVKMELDNSGGLNARLTVERVETLDLLQRDSRALERALSQAGLDSSRTNLEFSLKQNPFAGQNEQFADGGDHPGGSAAGEDEPDDLDIARAIPGAIIHTGTAAPGGINMLA